MDEIRNCPYCNMSCDADWVDVGVGMVQCGPFHCHNCMATEIGPHDKPREFSSEEKRTGWYAPYSEPGSSANVINGKVVSHKVMKSEYQKEFTDNPLWHDKKYVDDWYENFRKAK